MSALTMLPETEEKIGHHDDDRQHGYHEPVPHESILSILPLNCGCFAKCWKIPSAIVDRQILPRQTNSTDSGWSGIFSCKAIEEREEGRCKYSLRSRPFCSETTSSNLSGYEMVPQRKQRARVLVFKAKATRLTFS